MNLLKSGSLAGAANTSRLGPESYFRTLDIVPCQKGNLPMTGDTSQPMVLHELDLGRHTLFVMSDHSIDLLDLANENYLAGNGIQLDREETYRLFISLQEVFK